MFLYNDDSFHDAVKEIARPYVEAPLVFYEWSDFPPYLVNVDCIDPVLEEFEDIITGETPVFAPVTCLPHSSFEVR